MMDDVKNAEMNFVKGETAKGVSSMIIDSSDNIKLFQSFGRPDKTLKDVTEERIQ
jgi:hypothetical protein